MQNSTVEHKDKAVYRAFEDLMIWQRARQLSGVIYQEFGLSRDFGFRDQICRASVSVMNNIAEGYERGSKKDFVRFLFIAKGSVAEVRSMVILAEDLGYLDGPKVARLRTDCTAVSRMISKYISTTSQNANL